MSLGCSKNLVDSEALMAQLFANNFQVSFEKDTSADLVVINTCGFIKDAKQESIETILQHVRAKELGTIKQLYVMGCLAERYMKDLKKEIKVWQHKRNTNQKSVNWQFKTDDARIKLHHLYPQF